MMVLLCQLFAEYVLMGHILISAEAISTYLRKLLAPTYATMQVLLVEMKVHLRLSYPY